MPDLDKDLAEFRARAREWLERTGVPEVPMGLDDRFDVLRQWQRSLYVGGWMGLHWPVEFGGQGLTALHYLAFYEELAEAGAPAPIGLVGLDVVGPSILQYGTSDQCRRLLPSLLSGDEIWCQGFSEPDAGSDLASLRTSAELIGDRFVVNGQKVWTSWAHEADWCAVLARTDANSSRHSGISYLIVPMNDPGVTVRPIVQLTGDAEFSEVFFDDVAVPRDNLLGEIGNGWRIAMHTLSSERSVYALRRRVELETAFRSLINEIDGGPGESIAARSREDLGHSYIVLQVLKAQTTQTLRRLWNMTGPNPIDSMDKLMLTSVEQRIYSAGLDLVGPRRMAAGSQMSGMSLERWIHGYLNSRAASIYGGTEQIQRNIVGERYLGLPRGV